MKVEKYLRLGAVMLLGGTAWFSYAVINESSHRIFTHFAFELSQNLYFVGLVLTYVLWGAILKLRETRTRLIQLVLALGVYFSAFAADYALRNLYPNAHGVWRYVTPALGCFLPAAWAYSFLCVSEEARLAPSRIVAVLR
jgi:predicted neutral ceramidase superfamily lipid hydrolase